MNHMVSKALAHVLKHRLLQLYCSQCDPIQQRSAFYQFQDDQFAEIQ